MLEMKVLKCYVALYIKVLTNGNLKFGLHEQNM